MSNDDMVELPDGNVLCWEDNKSGGRTYTSSEVVCGVFVWDTCLVDKNTLLAAILNEERLLAEERRAKKKR